MGQIDLGSVIGPQGPQGAQGAAGQTAYVHIKWAASGNPADENMLNTPNEYIGICSDNSAVAPSASSSYQWYRWKGEQGIQGVQGIQGETGPAGAQGPAGPQGTAGPNQVTNSTATNIAGLLKGNGSAVSAAVAGTDYAAANHGHNLSALTQDSNNRLCTDGEKAAWNAKQSALGYTPLNAAGGTMGGQLNANASSQANCGTAQVRDIYAGTGDMTPGSTYLASGSIYIMYE